MSNDPRNLALRRLFARAIDQFLFMFLVHWIVGTDELGPLLVTALFLAFVPIDTVLTWLFGMTLGKLICRIRVITRSGQPIGFWQAFERSIRVWFFGQAAGIGVLMPLTTGVVYNNYVESEGQR
jgi:uncharacterized RDD family membrane protein YckC